MRALARIESGPLHRLVAMLGLVYVLGPSPALAQALAAAEAARDSPIVTAVASVNTTVADLDRSVEFYTRVLSFENLGEIEAAGPELEQLTGVFGARCRVARLKLGTETLELTQFLAPEGRPILADSRSNDRWFQHIAITVSDIDMAYAQLRRNRVRHASTGPQVLPAWNASAGGIGAFYFKDPDGHVLEIIHFPPGKGDPRWQAPTDRLFLGIDHTAIVVADTGRSLALYRDALRFRVAGESENFGTEQEHLNNVFGARLRITSLRASFGPGIELLEYLAPTDGRALPDDSRANDLWHWNIALSVQDAQAMNESIRSTRGHWTSPGIVHGVEHLAAASAAFQARDPDGHALVFELPIAVPAALTSDTPQR